MKIFFVVITALAFVYSCSQDAESGDKKTQLEKLKKEQSELKEKIATLEAELSAGDSLGAKSKLVAITEMTPRPFMHYIEVQAKVKGDEDVVLSAESIGSVTAVDVRAGDRVTKGQVLATIDDRIIRQQIGTIQSQLDLATQLFEKQKNLWDQKIGSEVQFLQAKTNKESLEKQMGALSDQLDMTRIKAPFNGTVDEVMIKTGQSVAPGVAAIRLVNLGELKVVAEIAESFISKVHKGDKVVVEFPDLGKVINTHLDYSGQAINTLNRTFNVEVRLSPSAGTFHPNMMAILKILDYESPKAFSIPENSIQKSKDGQFVYVVSLDNGKTVAHRKEISTGIIYNGITEVTSGLDSGDKVITTGFQNVIDGDVIKF